MDSNKFLCGRKEGYSKAQACLKKILTIICSVHPQERNSETKSVFPARLLQLDSSSVSLNSDEKSQSSGNRGFLFDLNVELTSTQDYSTDQNQINNTDAAETNVEDVKNEKERSGWEEGSLVLTIETGEVSSENSTWPSGIRSERGGFGFDSEMETRDIKGKQPEKKGRDCRRRVVHLYGRFDEVSPLVKRGRKRVLPCRYRDSELLQRLARNAGSSKRHRLR